MASTVRTPAIRARFLEVLSEHGNVTLAAQATGWARDSFYRWRKEDLSFHDDWEAALALGVAGLEDHAIHMAIAGSEKLVMFLLQARKPEVYGQRQQVELTGSVALSVRRAPIEDLRAELAQLVNSLTVPPLLTIEAEDDTVVPFPPKA